MAPSKISLHRMSHDVKVLVDAPPAGISAWVPCEQNMALVEAQVMGPDDTPYAGGLFQLRIAFPDRYPLEPPNVKFTTKVYHPNVSHDGNICLSVLNMPPKGDWTPAHSLRTVLLSIQSLLSAPNPDDPLDAEAARELKTHPHLFRSRATEWTRLYACPGGRTASAAAAKAAVSAEPSTSGAAGPSGAASKESFGTHRLGPAPGPAQAEPVAAGAGATPAVDPVGPEALLGRAAEAQPAHQASAQPGAAAAESEAAAQKSEAPRAESSRGPASETGASVTQTAQAAVQTARNTRPSDTQPLAEPSDPLDGPSQAGAVGTAVQVQALTGTQGAGAVSTRSAPKSRLALGKRARA